MPVKVFGMISTDKSKEYTWPALQSFFAHTAFNASEDEIHLIDNDAGSLDAAALQKEFPAVRFRSNAQPLGFAENMNSVLQSAEQKSADAYLLNNDLIFTDNWLGPLEPEHRCLLSPVSNANFAYANNGLQLSLTMTLNDFLGKESQLHSIVVHHRKAQQGFQITHSLPYFCVKIPHVVYKEVGFLDPLYSKAGFEDSDYSVRCWEKGIPQFYALQSFVLHFYGKSSWKADSGAPPVDPDPKIGRRGELLFRKRWGEEMAEMFAVQNPKGQRALRRYQDQALMHCYIALAQRARAFRNTVENPDELEE